MGSKYILNNASLYSVAWIAALSHERAAALSMLDERHDEPTNFEKNPSDQNSYSWGRVGRHNIVIASLPLDEYGLVSAADTASGLRATLPHIRIGLLVGIGAGIPRSDGEHDALLGDVVVSNPDGTTGGVVQFDLYKAKSNDTWSVHERKGFLNSPPRALRSALAALHAEHLVAEPRMLEFLSIFARNPKTKRPYGFPGSTRDRLRTPGSRTHPEIHYGTIISGNVLCKSGAQRDALVGWLRKENIDPFCLEMEAAGLMNNFPCLVIRGICDYADEYKTDDWQCYAAGTAAAFAKEFLQYVSVSEVQRAPRIADVLDHLNVVQRKVEGLVASEEQHSRRIQRQNVLDWLDPPKVRIPESREREPGTSLWFFESQHYHSWINGNVPFMFVHGSVGCGKTVLSKAVAEDLREKQTIQFFFSSTLENYDIDALLRFLVAQLCPPEPDPIPTPIQSIYESSCRRFPPKPPEKTDLYKLIPALLSLYNEPWYLLLDGVDEILPKSRRRAVTDFLNSASSERWPNLNILVTSRPAEVSTAFPASTWFHLAIPTDRVRDDIELYVTRRMTEASEFKSLDSALRNQVIQKLAGPGQAMFRYAYLQLERLLDSGALLVYDIADILRGLPSDLNRTYDAILGEVNPRHQSLALAILRWLTFAARPLLLEELLGACDIDMHETNGKRRLFTADQILALLPNLVSVRSDGYVAFSHFSVKEYLTGAEMPPDLQRVFNTSLKESHHFLASICVFHLAHVNTRDLWSSGNIDSSTKYPLRSYAWDFWAYHTETSTQGNLVDEDVVREKIQNVVLGPVDRDHVDTFRFIAQLDYAPESYSIPPRLLEILESVRCEKSLEQVLDSLRTPYFFEEYTADPGEILNPLGPGKIRILRALPCDQTYNPPRFMLFTRPFDHQPTYDAISHIWGLPGSFSWVWLNGHPFSVMENIYKNLVALSRQRGVVQDLWIDALCIQTRAKEEAISQLPLMHMIFAAARQVVICLHNHVGSEVEWGVELVTILAFLIDSPTETLFQSLKTSLVAHTDRCPIRAIAVLFGHDWFSRAWVFQEIVLARKAFILCGTHSLDYDHVQQVAIASEQMIRWIERASDTSHVDTRALHQCQGWQCVLEIARLRQKRAARISLTGMHLMWATRLSKTTVLQDRFIALLGMMRPSHMQRILSTGLKQKAVEFVLNAIDASQSLCIFSFLSMCHEPTDRTENQPWTPNPHPLDGTISPEQTLPSWTGLFLCGMDVHYPTPLLLSEFNPDHGSAGFAAGGAAPDPLYRKEVEGRLHLSGFIVDEVVRVSEIETSLFEHVDQRLLLHRYQCSTQSGRKGLVSRRARCGDMVAVLAGGETPYILEHCHDDTYRFICECYIQGIMHGELLRTESKDVANKFHEVVLE